MHYFKIAFIFFLLIIGAQECLGQDVKALQENLVSAKGIDRLTILNDLNTAYHNISIDSALIFARQAVQVAETLGKDSLIANTHLRLCASFYFKDRPDSMILHAEFAKKIGKKINALEITSYSNQLLATAYERRSDYDDALAYNLKSLEEYKILNDNKGIGAVNHNLSGLYVEKGEYEKALFHGLEAEKLAELGERQKSKGLAALNIANIYIKLDKKEKSFDYYLKAKAIFNRDSFPIRHASVLEFIANYYYEESQIDSSIYYFSEGLKIHEELGNPSGIATSHGNLGAIYQEVEDWDKSYFHLQKSLSLKRQLKDDYAIAFDLTNLGVLFDLQNQQDSAEFYYLKAWDMAEKHSFSYVKEVVADQLSQFYEKSNQYKKALDFNKIYLEHLNKTKGIETEKKIASLEAQYESEKKENEIKQLGLQNEIQRSKTNAFRIGLFSLFALSFLIIFSILYRRKNERKLNILKQEMHIKEKDELDKELNFKTKQLTSHALHMVQKNKVLQEIKYGIGDLVKEAGTQQKKALRLLIRRIDFNIQSDEDWDTFKLYFEQTNQDFYTNLAKVNRELTSTELKLCSLIKLNMNIKETASVLNIEPTSVKTARHRLRKKLNLKQGQDLAVFIQQVA